MHGLRFLAQIVHIESPDDDGVGFRGVGEGGMIVAPATLTNAIADALAPFGVQIDRTPLRPCDVLALIDAARPY